MAELPEIPGVRLEARIAEGGVGRVYGGVSKATGQRVAVKVLRAERTDNPEFVARALQEGRICWSLNHPNVVRVVDYGILSDGRSYLVMERLKGETLWQRVDRTGTLTTPKALHVGRQLARGLCAVHERGAIHRDIKPENLFLCDEGPVPDLVKILDLGIVALGAKDPRRALWTRQGAIFGSPGYMSPEQCRGIAVDKRTDIYSVGAVLYFGLYANIPWGDARPLEIISRTARALEPPDIPGDYPESVRNILRTCLHPNTDERYQRAEDLLSALEVAAEGTTGSFGDTTIVMRGRRVEAKDLHLPTLGDAADHRRFREHVMLAVASMFAPGQLPPNLRLHHDRIEQLTSRQETVRATGDAARTRSSQLARELARRSGQLEHALSQLEAAREDSRQGAVSATARLMGMADRIGDIDRRYTTGYREIEKIQEEVADRAREHHQPMRLEDLYGGRVRELLDELERKHSVRGEVLRDLAQARVDLRSQHRRVKDLSHQILELKRSVLSVQVDRETTLAELEDLARSAEDELLELERELEHAFLSLGVGVQVAALEV